MSGVDKALVKEANKAGGAAWAPLENADEQPWGTWYDRFGGSHWLPQDAFSIHNFRRQGLTLTPPAEPEEQPTTQLMANGTIFEFGSTEGEWHGPPGGGTVLPTATYYTAAGTPVTGLADPDSLIKYLEAGLTLDPPTMPARSRELASGEAGLKAVGDTPAAEKAGDADVS